MAGAAMRVVNPTRPAVTIGHRVMKRFTNVYADLRVQAMMLQQGLAVPLVFKDRLIGVLDLESVEYNAFTEQHEQMLATLASYVAVALENARLYERVMKDEKRLESDLATARDMQTALLLALRWK